MVKWKEGKQHSTIPNTETSGRHWTGSSNLVSLSKLRDKRFMSSHQELRTTKDVEDSEGKNGTYPQDCFLWKKREREIPMETDLSVTSIKFLRKNHSKKVHSGYKWRHNSLRIFPMVSYLETTEIDIVNPGTNRGEHELNASELSHLRVLDTPKFPPRWESWSQSLQGYWEKTWMCEIKSET